MRPASGLRFTWQLNTLMKMEMRGSGRSPSASSSGGTASVTRLTRPSAGATKMPSRAGVTRCGSRKKYAHHSVATCRASRAAATATTARGDERKAADEGIAFRMDRRELRADRVDDGHAALIPSTEQRHSRPSMRERSECDVTPRRSAAGTDSCVRHRDCATVGRIAVGRGRFSSSTTARISRAICASRWRFHMLA